MVWLIKRGDIFYRGDRVNGKERYRSLHTTSELEARAAIKGDQSPAEPTNVTEGALAAKIEAYRRHMQVTHIKAGTIELYNRMFLYLQKYVKSLDAFTVKNKELSADLYEFIQFVKKYAPATQGIHFRALRTFLRWSGFLAPKGMNPSSDILRLALVGEKDEFRGRFLTDEEKEILFSCAGTPHMEEFLRFKYASGLRLNQVLSLTWGQLNFKTNTIHVLKQKRQKERFIPMIDLTGPRQEGSMDSDRVFPQWKDKNGWYSAWNRCLKRARNKGLKGRVRPHDLRHTRASDLVQKHNFDAFDLLTFFGWSDLKLAERYVHTGVNRLRAKLLAGRKGS